MFVEKNDRVIFFDVDDTLIFWDEYTFTGGKDGYLEMTCPYDGKVTHHRVHERHVEFLKKQSAKGNTIGVWSQSGTKWAEAVVKKLGIQDYVDIVMMKPYKCIDDLSNANDILGNVIYLDEKGHSI